VKEAHALEVQTHGEALGVMQSIGLITSVGPITSASPHPNSATPFRIEVRMDGSPRVLKLTPAAALELVEALEQYLKSRGFR
jgi:hypothetical protein